MQIKDIKISVVTVCYNAADSLEETILSVINQNYENLEYIIIDGGSTDGTVDIIKKYSNRITLWISEPDKGIYDAMNKGILFATGEYINFMNAGDRFYKNDTLLGFVQEIKYDNDIIFGNTIFKYKTASLYRKPLPLSELKYKPAFCHQSTLIKRRYHLNYNYDLAYRIGADYNFFYNSFFNNKAKFQYIDKVLAVFDCAEGTSTDNLTEALKEKFKIWGIENREIKKLPWKLSLIRSLMAHKIKKLLSPQIVITVKKIIDQTRSHID